MDNKTALWVALAVGAVIILLMMRGGSRGGSTIISPPRDDDDNFQERLQAFGIVAQVAQMDAESRNARAIAREQSRYEMARVNAQRDVAFKQLETQRDIAEIRDVGDFWGFAGQAINPIASFFGGLF